MCAAPREILMRRTQRLNRSGFFQDCGAQWAILRVFFAFFYPSIFLFFLFFFFWGSCWCGGICAVSSEGINWALVALTPPPQPPTPTPPPQRGGEPGLTWSFQHTTIKYVLCVCVCVCNATQTQHRVSVDVSSRVGSFMTHTPYLLCHFPHVCTLVIGSLVTGAFILYFWEELALTTKSLQSSDTSTTPLQSPHEIHLITISHPFWTFTTSVCVCLP